MTVSKIDFLSFVNTLSESVRVFQRQVTTKIFDLDFVKEILDPEFNYLNDVEILLSDFKHVKLNIKREKDYSGNNGDITIVLIEKKSFEIIKVFDTQSKSFIRIDDDAELEKLALSDFVFANIVDNEVFILQVPTYLGKCYDRISERHMLAVNFNNTPEKFSKLNGLFSNESIKQAEESIDLFDHKLGLIDKLHMHSSLDKKMVKLKLQQWLSMFNEKLFLRISEFKGRASEQGFIKSVHYCILKVLYAHSVIDHTSIQNFLKQMEEYSINKELIISLKHPGKDQNGLNQILTNNLKQRIVEFDHSFSEFCKMDLEIDNIVIVSDVFISGQQTEKAFKHYFSPDETEEDKVRTKEAIDKEKYLSFSNSCAKKNFINNLRKVKKIVFMAPFITEKFSLEINSILNKFKVNASVELKYFGSLKSDKECFFSTCEALNVSEMALFKEVFFNKELMAKIFRFKTDEWKYHEKIDTSSRDFNIILRPQSLPAQHFKPFSWQVINGDALLIYRKNWLV